MNLFGAGRDASSRPPLLLWAGLLLLVLLASVFGRPDIPIDETRYVSVAWEMWSGGDWLVLHRNGIPYHHKPPLLFWLIGLGWQVFGVNDWWPRAISALFSFACLLMVGRMARHLWPGDEARPVRAGWIVLGTAFWLFFSTSVIFDVMLTACVLLSLLGLLEMVSPRFGRARRGWWWFVLGIGLGALAKGPVVLLHVLPPALLAPWWSHRQVGGAGWFGRVTGGVLAGAAIALCWAIPAAWLGGEEFRQAIFWGQTAGRVSGSMAHRQPFWFYLAVLPLILFPWFFLGSTWAACRQAILQRQTTAVRFCVAWVFPAFIGFSLSGGKQAHYILPLLPAFALLFSAPISGKVRSWALGLLFLAAGAGLLLAPQWATKYWFASQIGVSWQVAGAGCLVLSLLALGRLPAIRLPHFHAVLSLLFVCLALLGVLRPLSTSFDTTPMGLALHDLQAQDVPIAHASAYNDQFHYYGRLTRPLTEISRADVPAWLASHPGGKVVVYLKQFKEVSAIQPAFAQPYLDGAVILLDADSLPRWQAPTETAGG